MAIIQSAASADQWIIDPASKAGRVTLYDSAGNPLASGSAPSALAVTGTAAAGAGVTVTLPAVASQFHYLTLVEIRQYAAAALTGGATPVIVTSTNLPGSPAWTFQTALAIGTSEVQLYVPVTPLRSAVVNTNTTIVCPATPNVIWRVNVFYIAAI